MQLGWRLLGVFGIDRNSPLFGSEAWITLGLMATFVTLGYATLSGQTAEEVNAATLAVAVPLLFGGAGAVFLSAFVHDLRSSPSGALRPALGGFWVTRRSRRLLAEGESMERVLAAADRLASEVWSQTSRGTARVVATLSLVGLGWGIGGGAAVTGSGEEGEGEPSEVARAGLTPGQRRSEQEPDGKARQPEPEAAPPIEERTVTRTLYAAIDLPPCREPRARRRDRARAEALWSQGIEASKQVQESLPPETAKALRKQALGLFVAAAEADPTLAKPYNSLGGLAYDQGSDAAAECFYRLALDHDPELRWPYVNLGKLAWAQRRCKVADRWLDDAIRRGSEEAKGIKHWVEVARRRGECRG